MTVRSWLTVLRIPLIAGVMVMVVLMDKDLKIVKIDQKYYVIKRMDGWGRLNENLIT